LLIGFKIDLQTKLEIANAEIETHRSLVLEKDKELLQQSTKTSEENWIKINQLTKEK
jgi:hypothetical protein